MDNAQIAHQIELAEFPEGCRVTAFEDPDGQVFRAEQEGADPPCGDEVLLTPEAARMYGEGPAVMAALTQLKHLCAAGLSPKNPNGTYPRTVFLGD